MTTQPKDRLLTIREVMQRTSLSRSYVYHLVKQGDFPEPIKLGPKCTRWSERALDQWLQEKLS
ncbi:helix-turn-helix transcriptional regulator [Altericroceibacterium endophyticum]|uniref:AlpA family phage regulatory protein n=1 Tax=Altericroceibacterium endophyticum TaxID=1808508 RepID=A0A6I4T6I8_9SPHN|nr:AlpA family transcriptional regulator [Altericroceibacterium endophyticum]MXO66278.1 AlpA family phage regulatory protein [Altericroceibacterium endophyticum]